MYVLKKAKEQMKLSTKYPTITCDAWCDRYKHRSYICITIHFIDSKLHLHKYSLKARPFDEAHTGEAIKDLISGVLTEFSINPNNVIVVSECISQNFRNSCFFTCLGFGQRFEHA